MALQVAAAALLELLLEGSEELADSLLNPHTGDKAPKKWQASRGCSGRVLVKDIG
jgi:hypothetical protein